MHVLIPWNTKFQQLLFCYFLFFYVLRKGWKQFFLARRERGYKTFASKSCWLTAPSLFPSLGKRSAKQILAENHNCWFTTLVWRLYNLLALKYGYLFPKIGNYKGKPPLWMPRNLFGQHDSKKWLVGYSRVAKILPKSSYNSLPQQGQLILIEQD